MRFADAWCPRDIAADQRCCSMLTDAEIWHACKALGTPERALNRDANKRHRYPLLDTKQEQMMGSKMADERPKLDLMTMADACLELRVSRKTVYRMIRNSVLPAPKKVGNFRQLYFKREDFEKACCRGLR
ncbi:helix-turn-helix domain-containing protein [Paucibacter sediminis]|uniref:Helix-turn-helix domain-containing protein n=1 Tax=Paucibacter sediminis TaxID=3019553 RepID=A0AA95NG34_9BURK|nr:helix-turn-helix domain-containing protein [Paucibacter sp. S2-9]WIT12272.1 helix-turn-helix domain-containing protein [Paucibacter sp. S2-9]